MKLGKPEYILERYGVYGFELENGARILGMPYPSEELDYWESMKDVGIDAVICLTEDKPMYGSSPLQILASCALSDKSGSFYDNEQKQEEAGEEARRYRDLARQTAEALREGKSVAAHCKGGTGRTGTLIGAALLELGFSLESVLTALEQANSLRRRGDHGWPESPWQMDFLKTYS
jgi:hypothetical protein